MKEAYLLSTSACASGNKPEISSSSSSSSSSLFGKRPCKFYALAVIILLAFWSVLTGTVSLNWSNGGNLTADDRLYSSIDSNLDVLEVEEREKLVRRMWDAYNIQSRQIQLPKFWREAFEAAYEELTSDDAEIRDSVVSEIAKMSMWMLDLEPPSRHSRNDGGKDKRNGVDGAKAKSVTLPSVQVH